MAVVLETESSDDSMCIELFIELLEIFVLLNIVRFALTALFEDSCLIA